MSWKAGLPVGGQQPLLDRVRLHPPQRLHARVLGRAAPAHLLHDEERRQVVEVGLAAAGRAGGAHGVVDPEPGAEDRRVADPARDLEGEAARGGDAADLALRADAVAVDRAVAVAAGRGAPPATICRDAASPACAALRGIEPVAGVDAPLPLAATSAREASVLRSASIVKPISRANAWAPAPTSRWWSVYSHHRPRDPRRRAHALERGHAARPLARPVHAAGVELHHPVRVGQAAVADVHLGGVELDDVDPGDEGVEHVLAGHDARARPPRRSCAGPPFR